MTDKRMMRLAIALLAAIVLLPGCASMMDSTPYENYTNVYLQNNIHYQAQPDRSGAMVNRASYANYTDPGAGHKIAPVNTAVTIGKWRNGFTITRQDTGELIYFEFKARNMGGMNIEQYLQIITGPQQVALKGLGATDRKGIQEGQAKIGMTKKGVQIALGYPARHRTPSLEDNVWTYWRTRWVMRTVTFDAKGKVVQAR
jgi:outer membrane protein assembly factor BamE (lipoprotein component of BamABCDE complex)